MLGSTMSDSFYYGQDLATSSAMKSVTEHQDELVLYIPEMEEIRISPIVARKGFLNVLEQKLNGWKKRWVVSIFLYFLFYNIQKKNISPRMIITKLLLCEGCSSSLRVYIP